MERIRLDSFRRNTLSSASGHATISVFKDLVIPITNTLSPKLRYGVKAKLITYIYQSNYFYFLAILYLYFLKKLS